MAQSDRNQTDGQYKILIVDDEKEVLNALTMTLQYAKQFTCEISVAHNAQEALRELEKHEFDLIMADCKMPGMNGVELLEVVKNKYPNTTRMLITGYTDYDIAKEAINKAEVYSYIEKPWDNKNLRVIVHEALKNKNKMDNEDFENTRQKVINWLMKVYDDAKNMGLDLSTANHYVEKTKSALDSNDWENALIYANRSVNKILNLAESSAPELSIKKLENVQLKHEKWNELDIEVTNNGNVHANDVKLAFQGEFEVRGAKSVRIIKVKETKVISVELLPNKKGIFPLEINLSCKKMFDESEIKFEDRMWIQIGDIEGKTTLKRKFGYYKGYIKMELNIINEDLRDIKNVNLELIYDINVLHLSHIKPIYNKISKKFQMGDIKPRDGKNILLYFDPLCCTDTVIGGGISYKDWQDYEKYIMLTPQKIKILCPILSTKDKIGLIDLNRLLNEELHYSGNKIINIPLGLNIEDTLKTCKEMIFKYNTTIIQEIVETNPYVVETWFYGITNDSKYKFAIKIRIDEDTNCIELFIASSNNAALTGLLTDILFKLNQDLENKGIIMQPLKQIENITLKENLASSKKSLLYKQLEILDKNLQVDFSQKIIDEARPLSDKFESISRRENFHLGKRRETITKMY